MTFLFDDIASVFDEETNDVGIIGIFSNASPAIKPNHLVFYEKNSLQQSEQEALKLHLNVLEVQYHTTIALREMHEVDKKLITHFMYNSKHDGYSLSWIDNTYKQKTDERQPNILNGTKKW